MKTLLLPLVLLAGYVPNRPATIDLKGYYACRESLDEATGGVLTCYATTQLNCLYGTVILAYQKSRAGEIVDTVQVQAAGADRWVSITRCNGMDGQSQQYFVVFNMADAGPLYVHHIMRAWRVSAQGKLVAVPSKTLTCLNNEYGEE